MQVVTYKSLKMSGILLLLSTFNIHYAAVHVPPVSNFLRTKIWSTYDNSHSETGCISLSIVYSQVKNYWIAFSTLLAYVDIFVHYIPYKLNGKWQSFVFLNAWYLFHICPLSRVWNPEGSSSWVLWCKTYLTISSSPSTWYIYATCSF